MRLSKVHHFSVAWPDARHDDDSEVVREFSDRCQFLVAGKCADPLSALIELTAPMPRIRSVAARVAIDRVILKVLLHVDAADRRDDRKRAFLNAVDMIREEDQEDAGRATSSAVHRDGIWVLDKVNSCESPALAPHQIRTVSKAIRYIRDHGCRHSFSLQHLAAAVNVSAFHLDRLLKMHTGESFVTHRTTARIERAKGLLMSSTFSIKEISAAVGFNNVGSFDRAFKRTCGVQPSRWRETRLCERQVWTPVATM